MNQFQYKFSSSVTEFYLAQNFSHLKKMTDSRTAVIITDENVYNAHHQRFKGWNVIVLKAGEQYKVQETVDGIIEQLIEMEADRKTTLIGVGGGVITDLTGYVASIYMRGLRFGFVPTSVLAMVDASIGGKNGVDVGVYKNMVGIIRQPAFILYDLGFLNTLPQVEWENGFAEIIKHACIKSEPMFRELENHSFMSFQGKKRALTDLIARNVHIKASLVKKDEFEKGERRLLNFGHTIGHALENQYELSHGQAVAIGMTYASVISSQLSRFKDADRVISILGKYSLPTYASFNLKKVMDVLKMDKKRESGSINYVLLHKIGKGIVQRIKLTQIERILNQL